MLKTNVRIVHQGPPPPPPPGTHWVKRPDPDVLPIYGARSAKLSQDGKMLFVAGDSGNTGAFNVYDLAGSGWALRASVPYEANGGFASAAVSSDGSMVAIGVLYSPLVRVFKWDGTQYTQFDSTAFSMIPGTVWSVYFESNSSLWLGHAYNPQLTVLDLVEGTWVKRTVPTIATSNPRGIVLSANSDFLAIALDNYRYIYTGDYVNGTWVARAFPAVLPSGNGRDIAISEDNNRVAIATQTTPLTVYDWVSGAWVPTTTPAGAGSNGIAIDLSPDGNVLSLATVSSPYVYFWDWEDDTWKPRPSLDGVATGEIRDVSLALDGNTVAVACASAPYIRVYDWIP